MPYVVCSYLPDVIVRAAIVYTHFVNITLLKYSAFHLVILSHNNQISIAIFPIPLLTQLNIASALSLSISPVPL